MTLPDEVDAVGIVPVDIEGSSEPDEVELLRLSELDIVTLAELDDADVEAVSVDEEFVYVADETELSWVLRVITLVYRLRVVDVTVEFELPVVASGVRVELIGMVNVEIGVELGGIGGQVVTVLLGKSGMMLLSVECDVVVLLHDVESVGDGNVPVLVNEEIVSVVFGGAVLLGTAVLLLHDAGPVDVDIVPVPVSVGEKVVSVMFGGAVLLGTTVVLLHNDDESDEVDIVPVPVSVGEEVVSVMLGVAVLLGTAVVLLQDDEPDGEGMLPVLLTEEETVLLASGVGVVTIDDEPVPVPLLLGVD